MLENHMALMDEEEYNELWGVYDSIPQEEE